MLELVWLYFIHTCVCFGSLAAWSLQGEEVGKNLDDGEGPSPVGRSIWRYSKAEQ